MALLQTALLGDKVVGLSCLFFIFWMIPDVVIEWHPAAQSGESLIRGGASSTLSLHQEQQQQQQQPAQIEQHHSSLLFAPPEEWSRHEFEGRGKDISYSKYMSMIKHFLVRDDEEEEENSSKKSSRPIATMELLSTVESLAEKTTSIDGDFVQLGSMAEPAIIAQAAWRMYTQRHRKSILLEASTPALQSQQRELFEQAGVMDPNTVIFLSSKDNNTSNSIAILMLGEESVLENWNEMYARVPLGGYVIINNRNDLSVFETIANIHVDGTIAVWEKTTANANVQLMPSVGLQSAAATSR